MNICFDFVGWICSLFLFINLYLLNLSVDLKIPIRQKSRISEADTSTIAPFKCDRGEIIGQYIHYENLALFNSKL